MWNELSSKWLPLVNIPTNLSLNSRAAWRPSRYTSLWVRWAICMHGRDQSLAQFIKATAELIIIYVTQCKSVTLRSLITPTRLFFFFFCTFCLVEQNLIGIKGHPTRTDIGATVKAALLWIITEQPENNIQCILQHVFSSCVHNGWLRSENINQLFESRKSKINADGWYFVSNFMVLGVNFKSTCIVKC